MEISPGSHRTGCFDEVEWREVFSVTGLEHPPSSPKPVDMPTALPWLPLHVSILILLPKSLLVLVKGKLFKHVSNWAILISHCGQRNSSRTKGRMWQRTRALKGLFVGQPFQLLQIDLSIPTSSQPQSFFHPLF
jgi:hypothetical protein